MSVIRPATELDTPELLRHRGLLLTAVGHHAQAHRWQSPSVDALRRLVADRSARVVVIDGEDGLAASVIGFIDQRLPTPDAVNGLRGLISHVVVDPRHRRRGHARALVTDLLTWYADRGVARVELLATQESESLYRALGFWDHVTTPLVWRGAGAEAFTRNGTTVLDA